MRARGPYQVIAYEPDGSTLYSTEEETLKEAKERARWVFAEDDYKDACTVEVIDASGCVFDLRR